MSNITESNKWEQLVEQQKSKTHSEVDESQPELIDHYFFLFDSENNEILYVTKAFEQITGYKCSEFTIEHLIKMIDDDDLDYFIESEESHLNFTNQLQYNEHFKFILSYTYRLKKANGQRFTIQQQCQTIEINDQGHLSKTLVIHKVIPDYNDRPLNDHKIYDKTKNVYIDSGNCYKLTKREMEILDMIKEGLSSDEISQKTFISKHTISTHRKNILYKSNSNSFIELFKKLSFNEFV